MARAVVVEGVGDAAVEVARAARAAGLEVIGGATTPDDLRRGGLGDAASAAVLIATAGLERQAIAELALECTALGRSVWLDTEGLPELRGIGPTARIADREGVVLHAAGRLHPIRRALDVAVAAALLVLLSPLLLLVAALVKLSSAGPVLHRAVVVGQDGRTFTWYKFRTMRLPDQSGEAEEQEWRRRQFAEFVRGGEAPAKIIDQSRLTPVGRVLRRHSLDELPQLFSVLKGDMTLIGPRPCLVYEYELLKPWQRARFAVRPGLTGLWQVRGRGRALADEMVLMDICYSLAGNWRSDLRLLGETLRVMVSGRGAS